MIFADKLIQLRKKSGWSQEELAEQMEVTRQSVSKWESAVSVPDLEKIVRLANLFGVSIDYLLKDDMEETEYTGVEETDVKVRKVSLEEAAEFLKIKAETTKSVAVATFLCILSPISLFLLGAASENPRYGVSENVAAGVGMIVLLVLVAVAVVIFLSVGSKTSSFEYLETENFETEYGVSGMVKERREQFRNTYTQGNIIGTVLCILAAIPLFCSIMLEDAEESLLPVIALGGTLLLAGLGVMAFIRVGIIWESFQKLLQDGDYTRKKKADRPKVTAISVVYWMLATAVFLLWGFLWDKGGHSGWRTSWVVWPVAGVLYPALLAVVKAFMTEKS